MNIFMFVPGSGDYAGFTDGYIYQVFNLSMFQAL